MDVYTRAHDPADPQIYELGHQARLIHLKAGQEETIHKLAALGCHKSQVGDIPPEMRERMREWARVNAEGEDFELAEAFHRIEMRY